MPDQPENIDQLLKKYAEQRRQQGGQFEIDSETRKLLQSEVARAFPAKKLRERNWQNLFSAFWGRLAFGATMTALLAICTLVWIERDHPRPEERTKEGHLSPSSAIKSASELPQAPEALSAKSIALQPEPQSDEKSDSYRLKPTDGPVRLRSADDERMAGSAHPAPTYEKRLGEIATAPRLSEQKLSTTELPSRAGIEGSETRAQKPAQPLSGAGPTPVTSLASPVETSLSRGSATPEVTAEKSPVLAEAATAPLSFSFTGEPPKPSSPLTPATSSINESTGLRKNPPNAQGILTQSMTQDLQEGSTPLSISASATDPRKLGLPVQAPAVATNQEAEVLALYKATTRGQSDREHEGQRLYFAQADAASRFGKEANALPQPAILRSFQVEQNGNSIRIYDSDGSVYIGQIENAARKALLRASDALQKQRAMDRGRRSTSASESQNATRAAVNAPVQPADKLSFQAVGTNLSLNQKVVFEGDLLPGSAPTPSSDAAKQLVPGSAGLRRPAPSGPSQQSQTPARRYRRGGGAASEAEQTSQIAGTKLPSQQVPPGLAGRIEGKASFGGNEFQIEAVQVEPAATSQPRQ